MDIAVFSAKELPLVLRSLITVAANPKALTPREQQFLDIIAALHQGSPDGAAAAVTPDQMTQALPDQHHRRRLMQMALVMAMVEGHTTPQQQQSLKLLSKTLAVHESGLQVLQAAVSGHQRWAQFQMMRRMMSQILVPALHEEGIVGVNKIAASLFFKGGADPAIAQKYYQLERLPQGSLGHTFWQHYTQNGFPFPGEAGGIPERLVFHDLGHILSGYDTTPQAEIQQGAFQAGFIRKDGFAFLLFVILHFHWNIKITPLAEPAWGLFNVPLVIHALQRGAACSVDLSDHWNFWQVMNLPLDVVRDRYHIPPLSPTSLVAA